MSRGKKLMNIFETIGKTTHRIEPFHSQFLADALWSSLRLDPSLFNAVWELAAPPDWELPGSGRARVQAEQATGDGRRVDVCIFDGDPPTRVVGIEVKTVAASAEPGQLKGYLQGLKERFPDADVQVSYLTPFNRQRAGDKADRLRTVQAFDDFASEFKSARHISWLDIADIRWNGNPLWRQHQEYVEKELCRPDKLQDLEKVRQFTSFFGDEAAELFSEALAKMGITLEAEGTTIDLRRHRENTAFAASLSKALRILIASDAVSANSDRSDRFGEELRQRFLDSRDWKVHQALFNLSEDLSHVWVQGTKDYAVRVAHKRHSGGVSLVTARGPFSLVIGKPR